jgi:hypothetical protein
VHTRRAPVVLVSAVFCVAALRLLALPQSPAPQSPPPTFRSNVDLLTLEASVRDKRGAPVPDLQASDFTVTIDGRPRQVVFAHFFKANTASGARLTGGAPPTPRHVTNDEVMPGRVVVFVVDGESIYNGQEKALFETASKMLDALSPADAVGLLELPGPTIDVTRDHARVSEALKRFTGHRPPPLSTLTISYDEAMSIERGDQRTIDSVVARECTTSERRCSSGTEPTDVPDVPLAITTYSTHAASRYRDVIEVDGKPVADRRDRLQALFRSDVPDLQEARRIADEGARYNIGPVSRNFNVPTATLFFFHPGSLPRFTFRNKRSERIDGIDAVAVDFRETRRPTLIMNASGKDVPSSGTLWINPADGAVVRTRLTLAGFRGPNSYAAIDVTYRKDPALGMWVPSRMTERYSGGGAGYAETVATYADFKRFQTSARVTIPK